LYFVYKILNDLSVLRFSVLKFIFALLFYIIYYIILYRWDLENYFWN